MMQDMLCTLDSQTIVLLIQKSTFGQGTICPVGLSVQNQGFCLLSKDIIPEYGAM